MEPAVVKGSFHLGGRAPSPRHGASPPPRGACSSLSTGGAPAAGVGDAAPRQRPPSLLLGTPSRSPAQVKVKAMDEIRGEDAQQQQLINSIDAAMEENKTWLIPC